MVKDGDGLRWPGGVVPYVIDAAMPNQGRITDAITLIESSCSNFRGIDAVKVTP